MPKSWYDWRSAAMIEDPEQRHLYLEILADKKPYFMRYIYPDLMKRYNAYVKNAEDKTNFMFGKSLDELEKMSPEERTSVENDFMAHYHRRMPVGVGDCVINRICRKFEQEFDGHLSSHRRSHEFDYEIMKSGVLYTQKQYNAIKQTLSDYNKRLQSYAFYAKRERIDSDEANVMNAALRGELVRACESVCSDYETLCDVMLDVCYRSNATKKYAWDVCGKQIIQNLLKRNGYEMNYPTRDDDGDIEYCGLRVKFDKISFGGTDDNT